VILWGIIVWQRLLTLEQVWWPTINFTVLVMISFGLYSCILRTLHLCEQTVFLSTSTWQTNMKFCDLWWLCIIENGTLKSQSREQEKCRTPTVSVDTWNSLLYGSATYCNKLLTLHIVCVMCVCVYKLPNKKLSHTLIINCYKYDSWPQN
jgi:hypothetical protein